ncbi:MAG TPA: hypothetical protein P5137_12510 [Candidatus Brocadiia bacterium]|nr:hypothetical protein [Candidatus Brocadiia bacterium]
MTWLIIYRAAACATPLIYAVMALAAWRHGHGREALIAVLFAASNAAVFWR